MTTKQKNYQSIDDIRPIFCSIIPKIVLFSLFVKKNCQENIWFQPHTVYCLFAAARNLKSDFNYQMKNLYASSLDINFDEVWVSVSKITVSATSLNKLYMPFDRLLSA